MGLITLDARPGPVLVRDANGMPEPPSEIVGRLRRIHPSLGLRFSSGLAGSGWSLTWDWPETDRRWAWVQDGRVDPASAYDVVGYLPFGCSVDQAPGYVEASLKQYPREEVSRLRERMMQWNNVTLPQQQVETVVTDVVEATMASYRQPNPNRTLVRTLSGQFGKGSRDEAAG